jgi:hypothetical protein
MLTGDDFKKKWRGELVTLDQEYLVDNKLPDQELRFLIEGGLPREAAPFLNFHELERGLKRIYEIWGNSSDYTSEEKKRLNPYLVLGSDGSGNPIAIDINSRCHVVHLDHDDWFHTITFVNTSIPQLAEFLVCTREMIDRANSALSDEELDEGIPRIYKEKLFEKLEKIDTEAMNDGNFWKSEINIL